MPYRHLIIIACIMLVAGCSAGGTGEKRVRLVDENNTDIKNICVLPLYNKVRGVRYGPDSQGGKESKNQFLLKPYIVNSGDDIFGGLVRDNRKCIVYPMIISWGDNYSVDKLLLLKSGYEPKLIRRYEIPKISPITLRQVKNTEETAAVNLSLERQIDQMDLRRIFRTDMPISLNYDHEDYDLLSRCD